MSKRARLWLVIGFVFTFLFSVVWHFPASALLNLPQVQVALPKTLKVSQVQGVWWSGSADIQWQQNALGQVSWTWQPLALIQGQLTMQLQWTLQQQGIQVQLTTDGSGLELKELKGNLKLPTLSLLSPNLGLLADAKGELVLRNVFVNTPLQQPWPTAVSGQFALVDFNAMGIAVGLAEITPNIDNGQLKLLVSAKDNGWRLNGSTLLLPIHQFTHQYQLQADAPDKMPDWIPLMMRQTSPTQAVLNGSGRW